MTSPSAEALPWWTSVTLEELDLSADLVKSFIREGETPSQQEALRFARALALQTLVAGPAVLEEAIGVAAALTDSYRASTSKGAAEATRPDPSGWVKRSPEVRRGFELCLSMLPCGLADSVKDRMKEFSKRSKALEEADRDSYFREGTREAFTVVKTRTFPKHGPGS